MSATSGQSPRRGKILFADDEEIIRCSLALLLRMEGWQVLEAANGEEALMRARSEQPDVLLLDHRMPGLNGVEAYVRLKQEGLEIPTILVTAARDAEQLARSAGILHCLSKPFDFEELQAVLQAVLKEVS